MYGLVFDNTFSKQTSKTVSFVLMTYPTSNSPSSGHYIQLAQQAAVGRSNSPDRLSSGKPSPNLSAANDSSDHLPNESDSSRVVLATPRPKTAHGVESVTARGDSFYTGVLSKKRRKRNQGYARRFFSLDFTSSTLSYYKNRNSSGLRGAIPLSLAAVAVQQSSRVISIDSGAEIWILKAHSKQNFEGWRKALERASEPTSAPAPAPPRSAQVSSSRQPDPLEEREWNQAESLVGRVAGITDAVRRLAKDTDPKYSPGAELAISDSPRGSPNAEVHGNDYFGQHEQRSGRKGFLRRKSSNIMRPSLMNSRRSASAQQLAPPPPSSPVPPRSPSLPKYSNAESAVEHSNQVHANCMAMLRDLDAVVSDFSSLIAQRRQRRTPIQRPVIDSRSSMDSSRQEFFDAEDGSRSPVMTIREDEDNDDGNASEPDDAASINSASTISQGQESHGHDRASGDPNPESRQNPLFPNASESLYPLPRSSVPRRTTIPPSKGAPPSLISFLRKNVGKDLSTIAMPVTANEPLSLLQRQAEQMEYANLLNTASTITSNDAAGLRLLYVTAFAISSLACLRIRERAIRKPFNPMLGETFELVREDLGFRFLAEKISHRPVTVAYQAEGGPPADVAKSRSPAWSFNQSPTPSQKFWGKSAELVTVGRCRLRFHTTNQNFSWTPPNAFLRNIIAGEKYVEPVGSMTVVEENSGRRAVATFKSGGMFAGRSEDVSVATHGSLGEQSPLGLIGKWTSDLRLTGMESLSSLPDLPLGKDGVIWKAGPLVQPSPQARYGLTAFAATLNEITEVEKGALPPTDSRLRPDQRAHEEGRADEAEAVKAKLEEAQRRRRGEMEAQGETWPVRWFSEVEGPHNSDGENEGGVWHLKGSEDGGYWDVRRAVVDFKKGKWDGVREVFEI